MSKAISSAAIAAVTEKMGFEKKPHYCQRWVRQVVQSVCGSDYDKLFKGNAADTGKAMKAAGLSIPLTRGCVPGDLLYKLTGSGGDGHVGIRVEGNRVAENSSVHWDGKDARGFRSVKEFGNFDLIIRLV